MMHVEMSAVVCHGIRTVLGEKERCIIVII